MITPSNIARHELTGLPVTVLTAYNPLHAGVCGTIRDETKNMLVITGTKQRKIPKAGSVFRFTLPGTTRVDVDGRVLVNAPEKRISARIRYQR
jgi:ribonuclease P protein subunit POP4